MRKLVYTAMYYSSRDARKIANFLGSYCRQHVRRYLWVNCVIALG